MGETGKPDGKVEPIVFQTLKNAILEKKVINVEK